MDERDHLRIQINLAENGGEAESDILLEARRRLVELDRQIAALNREASDDRLLHRKRTVQAAR